MGDMVSGNNPKTDAPNAAGRPINSFHERYNSDAQFRRVVDARRAAVGKDADAEKLKGALAGVRGKGGKLY